LRPLATSYCHPGLFQVGERQIKIEMSRIALFLVKLSAAMGFVQYDKLTRTVYIQHMQAERKVAYAIAEKMPPTEPTQPLASSLLICALNSHANWFAPRR